jgi:steroid delta-isomerase-like uncharacterized protein
MIEAERVMLAWIDLWNAHAVDELGTLVAPEYVHHTMATQDIGLEGFQQGFQAVLTSFPDVRYAVVHTIAREDLAAVYLRSTATHLGDYFGVAPTGQEMTISGVYHCRVREGLIVEDWDIFDLLTPLFRLGARVSPPPLPS